MLIKIVQSKACRNEKKALKSVDSIRKHTQNHRTLSFELRGLVNSNECSNSNQHLFGILFVCYKLCICRKTFDIWLLIIRD